MPVTIAQASHDPALARSRAELLLQYGFDVHTFATPKAMSNACEKQRFDLLIIGHLLEYESRHEMRETFRNLNPGSPVLQLTAITETSSDSGANYNFCVSEGPEALVKCVEKILKTKSASAIGVSR